MLEDTSETTTPISKLIKEESDDAADTELLQELAGLNDEDTEESLDADELMSGEKAEIDAFMRALDGNPLAPQFAQGEVLWIGFDAEWVYDPDTDTNRVLSIQLYVPAQDGILLDD